MVPNGRMFDGINHYGGPLAQEPRTNTVFVSLLGCVPAVYGGLWVSNEIYSESNIPDFI